MLTCVRARLPRWDNPSFAARREIRAEEAGSSLDARVSYRAGTERKALFAGGWIRGLRWFAGVFRDLESVARRT